jgi:hypothetical protein
MHFDKENGILREEKREKVLHASLPASSASASNETLGIMHVWMNGSLSSSSSSFGKFFFFFLQTWSLA